MWSARYHVTKETSRFILSTGLGSWRASSDSCTNAATFRKDRRLNIRLSSKDLEAIQKRALAEGLPYQTLISSLLHKVRLRPPQGRSNARLDFERSCRDVSLLDCLTSTQSLP